MSTLGYKHTEETKQKMREAQLANVSDRTHRGQTLTEILGIANAVAKKEIAAAEGLRRAEVLHGAALMVLREDDRPSFDLWLKTLRQQALEEAEAARAEGVA